ncbi:MAG: HAD-IB family phosphatase [Deltaproteobacteria bacterium]|nr:HAD-IB family phosphatase [Deltaproteobacteria bacterium]
MTARAPADIRLIAFDLDGTLVGGTIFVWQTLHEYFGSDPRRRAQAREDYFAGRISYADWFANDLELLAEQGADRARMLDCFDSLALTPGAAETLDALAARGYVLTVISGSLDLLLEHLLPGAPFSHVLINRLRFDSAGRIAGGEPTPYDLAHKAAGLAELARREDLGLQQCAFVGDNTNDLEAMRRAGFAVGVNVKHPDVRAVADCVIEGPDLRALLGVS